MKFNKIRLIGLTLTFFILFIVMLGNISANTNVTTFSEMNTAIVNGDNITLTQNINVTNEDVYVVGSEGININRNTTIDGQGHSIDAQQKCRFFKLSNSNVLTLKNITLKNGKSSTGGAIYATNGVFVSAIGNVLFENNTSIGSGGAIYSQSGLVNIISSNGCVTFHNNIANDSGGAIYADKYIFISAVDDVLFENNTSIGSGGAIYATGLINVTSSNGCITFCNNTAINYGGAIHTFNDFVFVGALGDVLFENNTSIGGGAISTSSMNVTSSNGNVIFRNNKATNTYGAIIAYGDVFIGALGDVLFENNTVAYGGVIYSLNGLVNITSSNDNVYFCNNKATTKSYMVGSAISAGKDVFVSAINDILFENNTLAYGGAIYSLNGLVNVTSSDGSVTFRNNKATNSGGAISTSKNIFVGALGDVLFENNTSKSHGGAIYSTSGYINVISSNGSVTFRNNKATDGNGGAIYSGGLVNFTNIKFINNNANNGSTIYSNNIFLKNSIIETESNNTPIYIKGIVYSNNNTFSLSNNIAPIIFTGTNIISYVIAIVNTTDYVKLNTKTQINVTFYDDNNNIIAIINNELANITLNNTSIGYLVNDGLKSNINYDATKQGVYLANVTSNGLTNLTIKTAMFIVFDKKTPTVNVTGKLSNVGVGGNITIQLPTDATGTVNVTVNGTIYENKELINGSVIIPIDNLTISTYNVTINYSGNDNYYKVNKTKLISVKLDITNVSIKTVINNKTKGVEIIIYLPENVTKNITIIVNGNQYNTTINNNIANISISENLPVGNNTIGLIYNGNEFYNPLNENFNVEICKIKVGILNVTNKLVNKTGIINITVPTDLTGELNIIFNGTNYSVPINNGLAILNIINVTEGIYNILIQHNNSNKYLPIKENKTVIFDSTTLFIKDLTKYYGNSSKLEAILTLNGVGLTNKTITFVINGKSYNKTTDANGVASMNINLNPGVYNVTATFNNTLTDNGTITILVTIEASDLVKMYCNSSKFKAVFKDTNGNLLINTNVSFKINGILYTRTTNDKGVASLSINLQAGNYIITCYNLNTSEIITNNVTVLSTVQGADLIKYYHNSSQFYATFYDNNGKLLANYNVFFNINGVFYNRTTDNNGVAKLTINLQPGKYVLTAINPINKETISYNITIKPVLTGNNVTMTTTQRRQYVTKLVDGQGNPLVGQTVTININGVLYNRITDNNGEANLNINLNVGEYIATATWKETYITNKITVREF